jgi:hypothetical protein
MSHFHPHRGHSLREGLSEKRGTLFEQRSVSKVGGQWGWVGWGCCSCCCPAPIQEGDGPVLGVYNQEASIRATRA